MANPYLSLTAAPGSAPEWPEKMFSLGRSNSMELTNDPRFFSSNVIDKRLKALSKLTIVSSLMLGTALSQCFALDKRYHWTGPWQCTGVSAIQVLSFLVLMRVVFVCFMSLYTMCQQLYHVYRLMTSGPTGVELAGEYYLHPKIVIWRHTAINRLLKSFKFFVTGLGFILFVKIMKDGGTIDQCYKGGGGGGSKEVNMQDVAAVVTAVMNHLPLPATTTQAPTHHAVNTVEEYFQVIFAAFVAVCFFICAHVLNHIHDTHQAIFDMTYDKVEMLLPSTRNWAQASHVENHRRDAEPAGCWAPTV